MGYLREDSGREKSWNRALRWKCDYTIPRTARRPARLRWTDLGDVNKEMMETVLLRGFLAIVSSF